MNLIDIYQLYLSGELSIADLADIFGTTPTAMKTRITKQGAKFGVLTEQAETLELEKQQVINAISKGRRTLDDEAIDRTLGHFKQKKDEKLSRKRRKPTKISLIPQQNRDKPPEISGKHQ